MFAHITENQEIVCILIFHISEEHHSKLLELTALPCIKIREISPPEFIQPFIHLLDDVKGVEYESSIWKMLLHPTDVSIGHIHGNEFSLRLSQILR